MYNTAMAGIMEQMSAAAQSGNRAQEDFWRRIYDTARFAVGRSNHAMDAIMEALILNGALIQQTSSNRGTESIQTSAVNSPSVENQVFLSSANVNFNPTTGGPSGFPMPTVNSLQTPFVLLDYIVWKNQGSVTYQRDRLFGFLFSGQG